MAKLYHDLIKAGKWTIERVPSKWRAEVQSMLDAEVATGYGERN